MLAKPLLAGSAALFVTIAVASGARAFCRTTTCDNCVAPPGGCVTDGIPLRWPVSCIPYAIQKNASKRASFDEVTAIVDGVFETWRTVSCPGGGSPTFTSFDEGPVDCARHEYNDQSATFGGNANIIIFHDDGNPNAATPSTQLAITTVTFNVNNGDIYDADIEVDSSNPISTVTPVPPDQYDLQSILTHEVGHLLGLAHTDMVCVDGIDCPTMDATYRKGSDDFRTLEPDDVAAICDAYPQERTAVDNSCNPRHGFSPECGVTGSKGCCATAPGGASSRGAEGMIAMAAGLGIWIARARRRQSV